VENKVNVIKQIESGKNADMSWQFGLVNSTIQTMWKSRDKIIRAFEKMDHKRLWKAEQIDVDEAQLNGLNTEK
jgi:hypothetical protein